MKKRVLLVDFANSFFTLYHFKGSDKEYQFLNDLRKLAQQYEIDHILFANEGGKSAYRLKLHPAYKEQRETNRQKQTPAEQARYKAFKFEEMPACLNLTKLFGIKHLTVKGVEADDVISYVVRNIDLDRYNVMMLTTDQDMYQLIRPGVVQAGYNKHMVTPLMQGIKLPKNIWMNSKQFVDQYEIQPAQYAHVKALAGDSGDNYHSPKGMGETFALKLIQQYGSIEEVEKNLDTVKIPRLSQSVLDVLKTEYQTIYHNFKLANLNHSPEVDKAIFGEDGIAYLNGMLDNLEERLPIDRHAIKEYCYETGRVNIVDKLDMWLAPFEGLRA